MNNENNETANTAQALIGIIGFGLLITGCAPLMIVGGVLLLFALVVR